MPKKIINITDITSYLYCPRKLWLKLVKGIKEPPTQKMISGFLKHKVLDIFNKNEPIIVSSIYSKINEKEIYSLYKEQLARIIKEIFVNYANMAKSFSIEEESFSQELLNLFEPEIRIRTNSISQSLEQGFLGKELWRELKPKYLTEYEIISQELGLKGRIDRIKFSDSIIPYELKTRAEIYYSDKIQLAAYALLLEKEFNKPVELGIIETAEHKEEIPLTQELKSKVLEIAEKIKNLEEPPCLSNFAKCQACKFQKECYNED